MLITTKNTLPIRTGDIKHHAWSRGDPTPVLSQSGSRRTQRSTGLGSGRLHLRIAGISAILILASSLHLQAVVTLDEIIRILATNQLTAITNASVQDAAIDALVRAVNPDARRLTAAEAARIARERDNTAPVSDSNAPVYRPAVTVELWSNDIAYVRINGFFSNSSPVVTTALTTMATGATAGVIIDTRGARGEDAATLAVLLTLLPTPTNQPLFTIIDAAGVPNNWQPVGDALALCNPLMILIDEHTAGLAEILAADLKGRPGVLLIGRPTAARTDLLDIVALDDGTFLLIPARRIQPRPGAAAGSGAVLPDIGVAAIGVDEATPAMNTGGKPLTPETLADQQLLRRIGNDTILKRAVDLLLGLNAIGINAVTTTSTNTR